MSLIDRIWERRARLAAALACGLGAVACAAPPPGGGVVETRVLDGRDNFIDARLARFHEGVPRGYFEEIVNREFRERGGAPGMMAYLQSQGCAPVNEQLCVYVRTLRETRYADAARQRVVAAADYRVFVHFHVPVGARIDCRDCVSVDIEVGERAPAPAS
ncbi:MAG: hypothetical protein IPK81_05640 [Rhodospirillales bacterium]|nr:hypothetical protein [Rhodospirillales bacterium]QQS13706.1 MAG: hypothetical protein IPK81_05640 [Rhodospirillales bacterium]